MSSTKRPRLVASKSKHTLSTSSIARGGLDSDSDSDITHIRAPNAPQAKTPDLSAPYQDPAADFTLLSQDGVLFRVHSCYIMAHSKTFRDMFTHAPERGINFEDDELAVAQTIRDFLDTAITHKLFDISETAQHVPLFQLVKFLVKYECAGTLQTVRYCLREAVKENKEGIVVFVAAALMDDHEICRVALISAAYIQWPGRRKHADVAGIDECAAGECTMNVGAMSAFWLDWIPQQHLRVLDRAGMVRESNYGTEWVKVAEEYYRLMTGNTAKKRRGLDA